MPLIAPLVLLHTLGTDHRMWDPVVERLEGARRVLPLDLPGHGDEPPLADSSPPALAAAIADRLTRAGIKRPRSLPDGVRSVVLRGCGHLPTWDDPEQVARVLLVGSAGEPRH